MRLFRHWERLPADVRGAAVAIGNFDGVHLGHHAVIGEAGRIARSQDLPWAVLTFEPHPRSVFRPDSPPFRLTPFHRKARLIESLGVDVLFVVHFDQAFSERTAADFVRDVLVDGLAARAVVSGHNFAFGHARSGTPETLLHLGGEHGFAYTCVGEIRDEDGEPYSSTRVRRALAEGRPACAAKVLGRPFEIEGEVIDGDRRGRTIGFPTANVALGDYTRPARGVYAVRVGIVEDRDGPAEWHQGVANLGVRPSFGDSETVLLEAHLFDFAGDLYGRSVRVALIEYLRPEKAFDGLDTLRAQIAADSARARALFAGDAEAGDRRIAGGEVGQRGDRR